jgi:hypothetical protein
VTDKAQDGAAILVARLAVRSDAMDVVLSPCLDWCLERLSSSGKACLAIFFFLFFFC